MSRKLSWGCKPEETKKIVRKFFGVAATGGLGLGNQESNSDMGMFFEKMTDQQMLSRFKVLTLIVRCCPDVRDES